MSAVFIRQISNNALLYAHDHKSDMFFVELNTIATVWMHIYDITKEHMSIITSEQSQVKAEMSNITNEKCQIWVK